MGKGGEFYFYKRKGKKSSLDPRGLFNEGFPRLYYLYWQGKKS
jgi:hypothetical protein